MSQTQPQDVTALPQTIKDFILRQGYSLNPLCWQATYRYPEDAKAFEPQKQPLHFFILQTGGQLSLLTRHQPRQCGIVYELKARSGHTATKPAAPRQNLERPAPLYVEDDPLPAGTPGVDTIDQPDYFAQLEYRYPDDKTGVVSHYRISSAEQHYSGQLLGSTGKLALPAPGIVHYEIGAAVTDEQWQAGYDALAQHCRELSDHLNAAAPIQTWPKQVQTLHLIHTEVLHPGDPANMAATLFETGQPLQNLFETASEIWQRQIQRPGDFATRFSRWQTIDKLLLPDQLGQSFGVTGLLTPVIGERLCDLIYLLAGDIQLTALRAVAEQRQYSDPDNWLKEAALTALIHCNAKPSPGTSAGNQSPYFHTLKQIGQQLYQLAELQRQQDKVVTLSESNNKPVKRLLKVPEIGSNWFYQPSKNLSQPKRILRLGVFFDGTDQNRYNDAQLPDRDISNIAKLDDLYMETRIDQGMEVTYTDHIYIKGVGTTDGKQTSKGFEVEESNLGLGFGLGPEGGQARIAEVFERLKVKLGANDYDEIVFDVFGFSRGAALARFFTNLVNQWPEYYNPYDHSDPVPENDLYTVRAFPQHLTGRAAFVGLFDTVGSFYMPGNHDEGEINLNLNEQSAERVVHFVAAHEVRQNFPSTRISTETGYLPANFTEIVYPGVHADLGGGYENPTGHGTENWELLTTHIFTLPRENKAQAVAFLKQQYDKPAQHQFVQRRLNDVYVQQHKPTRKELSIYYLHLMHQHAKAAGVPLRSMDMNKSAHIIPNDLHQQLNKWKASGGLIETAKNHLDSYIHTSERIDESFPKVNKPREKHKQYERAVFYNHPNLAVK
ncbi:T6SS phospholipase effector Tle1-like catalytic domain-containing protein [Gynuella sunshinyii]|uniref:T6SS Phospholipase effector Tle1-like catalytic domain-containing protein n=1 Tax=Gynuella sunshinyii YC6258 TaxID=1445510 RepID=A0A0C5VG51_9GAMM|nr:DUF2235 domain-containing protein [Gynuella sunshinyii]AJQ93171.1 hypothetical protein YC6258_01123 [Gynuella sunshinyii YC6258]